MERWNQLARRKSLQPWRPLCSSLPAPPPPVFPATLLQNTFLLLDFWTAASSITPFEPKIYPNKRMSLASLTRGTGTHLLSAHRVRFKKGSYPALRRQTQGFGPRRVFLQPLLMPCQGLNLSPSALEAGLGLDPALGAP